MWHIFTNKMEVIKKSMVLGEDGHWTVKSGIQFRDFIEIQVIHYTKITSNKI